VRDIFCIEPFLPKCLAFAPRLKAPSIFWLREKLNTHHSTWNIPQHCVVVFRIVSDLKLETGPHPRCLHWLYSLGQSVRELWKIVTLKNIIVASASLKVFVVVLLRVFVLHFPALRFLNDPLLVQWHRNDSLLQWCSTDSVVSCNGQDTLASMRNACWLELMLSCRGIDLSCSSFKTFRWFCCTFPPVSDNSPQGWKQLNPLIKRLLGYRYRVDYTSSAFQNRIDLVLWQHLPHVTINLPFTQACQALQARIYRLCKIAQCNCEAYYSQARSHGVGI